MCRFPILYCVLASRGGNFTGMDLGIGMWGRQKGVLCLFYSQRGVPPLDPPREGGGGKFFFEWKGGRP